jgi:aldehyde dehydrogenase (NAD+)/aldehyde dehydrogenase
MFIAGRLVNARGRMQVTSPYDGRIVGEVSCDGTAQVAEAVTRVAACPDRLDPERRAAVLRTAARLVTEQGERFARLITSESGVCLRETRKEVERACLNLTVAAEEAARIRGETHDLVTSGKRRLAITLHEPAGVVAAITPFNRPLNQVVVKVAPAIAAGNRVVVKPSEKTPLTALEFAALLIEAGLPPGMLAVLTGPPAAVGPSLASDPLVDVVTFTGSCETGRAVAALAAGKKVLLELGGNDPLIVLADAGLERAARLAADGAFATAGQSCRGVKRILAAEQVADELAAQLTRVTKELAAGDPADPRTDVGPLISEAAAAEVERRCAAAVRSGAQMLAGGERAGALLTPTVLDHVPADAELVVRETFGPVAPIIRVRDAAEAAVVANSTPYGLQAGVVTDSAADFLRLARDLRVGAVNLMAGPNFDSPHIPFGGVKGSGVGREGIRYSIREMSTVKTVTMPWTA